MIELSSEQAWQNVNEKNVRSRWKSMVSRAAEPVVIAVATERVGIQRDDSFFCIGSCFAKNIEKKLVGAAYRVLSFQSYASGEAGPFFPLPNIFNIRSIVNEFRWGLTDAKPAPEESIVADDQGYHYDPHSTVDTFRGPPDVVRKRRAGVTATVRLVRDCRFVVITLGLVEVWYDRQLGVYLNATMPRFLLDREPARYVLRVLDYNECVSGLEETWELLQRHGRPDLQIFLSVSPQPLAATFTSNDVLVANTYSKSTQLAAARDFTVRHANVHYLPNYESVTSSARRFAWKSDLRHVTEDMVNRVTGTFLASQTAEGPDVPILQPVQGPVPGDWPVDPAETEEHSGVPKFFSARPGDRHFPAGFPRVTSSSTLSPQLDASSLMSACKRIWHSQQPPSYPEWLCFEFQKPLRVQRLFVQNQDRHLERSPRAMVLEALVGNDWRTVLNIPHAHWRYGGEWQGWGISRGPTSNQYRLRILSNCGDPNLVTVQNVYLSP
jgi:hypothetical protein